VIGFFAVGAVLLAMVDVGEGQRVVREVENGVILSEAKEPSPSA
jgi:hypothetical protein